MRIAHKRRGLQQVEVTVVVEYDGPYALEARVVDGIAESIGKAAIQIEATWRLVRFADDMAAGQSE